MKKVLNDQDNYYFGSPENNYRTSYNENTLSNRNKSPFMTKAESFTRLPELISPR